MTENILTPAQLTRIARAVDRQDGAIKALDKATKMVNRLIFQLYSDGISVSELENALILSRATIYRILAQCERDDSRNRIEPTS